MSIVHLIIGPQGAGKSTYSKNLAREVSGIHMSIDDWMWKMYGADQPKTLNLIWIMERVERCENQIWNLSKDIIKSGGDVVLDLGFTKREKRKKFLQLADEQNIETQIHFVNAPHAVRRNRVMQRNIDRGETFSFEVTPGMFDFMEGEYHRPINSELKDATIVNTETYETME